MTEASYFPVGAPTDLDIITLWRMGRDTCDIARFFWVHESYIAARLPSVRARARAREDQEWDRSTAVA